MSIGLHIHLDVPEELIAFLPAATVALAEANDLLRRIAVAPERGAGQPVAVPMADLPDAHPSASILGAPSAAPEPPALQSAVGGGHGAG
jgi:hypothetical protein